MILNAKHKIHVLYVPYTYNWGQSCTLVYLWFELHRETLSLKHEKQIPGLCIFLITNTEESSQAPQVKLACELSLWLHCPDLSLCSLLSHLLFRSATWIGYGFWASLPATGFSEEHSAPRDSALPVFLLSWLADLLLLPEFLRSLSLFSLSLLLKVWKM